MMRVASTALRGRLAMVFGVAVIATWPSPELLAGPATGPTESKAPSPSGEAAATADGETKVDPSTLAVSSEVNRARELAANGRALFQEGSYDAAIAAFTEAFSLVRDPNLLYNISVAEERAGRYSEAADALDRYRVYATSVERERLTTKAAQLRTQAEQQRAQHEAAQAREAREVREAAGAVEDLAEGDPQGEGVQTPIVVEPAEPKLFGPAAWALTGTTVVGLGLGLGLGVSASAQDAKAGGFCEGSLCASAASPHLDKARRHALGADLSFALAGVSAASLAILLGVKAGRSKERKVSKLRVDPVAGRTELGLRVRGRF